jgi:hypothetical protein
LKSKNKKRGNNNVDILPDSDAQLKQDIEFNLKKGMIHQN